MVQKYHAFMFPWFAFGRMIPYLHLANKLAEKGHRVTFLLPKKAQKQLEHHNLFPDNIVFHPLTIPPVDDLPAGAETASDIPISLGKFLSAAMDLTRDQVEAAVRALRPDLILFDFAYWVPEMSKEYKVKSILYSVIAATTMAHNYVPSSELGVPPPGYPSSKVAYRVHDGHALSSLSIFYKRLYHRMTTGLMSCDIISMRTCEEVEGKFCDYIARQYQRKVLLTGPMLPEPEPLEDRWSSWLTGFRQGSVVFCARGSQFTLEMDQFQELCLGMELTGLPFFIACQREETGWFSKESLSAVIISVMDEDSELGNLVRRNHSKLKEVLVSPGLLTGYTDKFVEALQDLPKKTVFFFLNNFSILLVLTIMGREMGQKFHAFMFPWFAFGHMTPYVHLANKLAEKGHRVTFLLPKKAKKQLEHLNLFPDSIVFHPITIPHVDGLPAGAETPSDIPVTLWRFLSTAMDLTRDQVEAAVRALRPDIILFDLAYWITEVAKEHGIKSMLYNVISATSIAHDLVPGGELGVPPPGYPSSTLLFRRHDAHALLSFAVYYKRFYYRVTTGLTNCDFISIRTCEEIEGKFCDYIGRQYQKKVLLTGPMLPEPDKSKPLEDKWNNWLSGFEPGSVVYCALGSQITLEKDQFQELCLGLELTGLPFFVAVTPPKGAKTIQEALPEGFEERVKGRGVVWGEWVQQPLILAHPSVGCFVSHCGFGSMWESLMSDCQIVLLPYLADQVLNTRLLTDELEVSVEVPREKTGWFSKENLSVAVTSVMDKDSEIGNLVRRNHSKLKEVVVSPGLLTGYTDNFVVTLENLLKETKLP
ncbi:hypothetical protein IGI04_005624 [Brassica rapa subsp. trilocularis]|nr:hypothetical protein IGI04_005624 [Brassica rapa subsp. trilocularis]